MQPTKFFDLRNKTIVFEPGVIIRPKSGSFSSSSQLFQLIRAQNVIIEGDGATFKMNNGQGKHALAIYKSNNITVRGLTLRESGGDGIYIAGDNNTGSYSQNITLDNVVSTDNKRHGLTIISAEDVYIKNSDFMRSSGSTTEVGVDLEPNNSSDRLVNINFDNCKFEGNDSSGFVIGTRSLTSSSTPISVQVKNSEFRGNDRSPHSSRPRTQLQLSQGSHNNPVTGDVRFENVEFNQSGNKIIFTKLSAKSYKVVFKDCSAENVSMNGRDPVIELQSLGVAQTMGGFTFENFKMEYDADVPFMRLQVPSNDIVKDIRGTFTIDEPNNNGLEVTGGYNTSNNQNVSINYKHIN
ncbi:MAG TPA: right-handed parallel beta-helix repeat-containing protein [Pricia sp.]|nr:right-handed parallel beta-helix repeat-containing protein [Pricia sp.]